jgi:hypothetical protein
MPLKIEKPVATFKPRTKVAALTCMVAVLPNFSARKSL